MKFLKIFIALTLLLVLLMPNLGFGKKRNLSTPLSRLVGHWQDSKGFHYYFTPVDQSSRIGLFTSVYPDKEAWVKMYREIIENVASQMLKDGNLKNEEEANEYIEGAMRENEQSAEKFAGIVVFCQYEVVFHIPEVKKVKITFLLPEDGSVPSIGFSREATFYVEKNGKQILIDGEWGEFLNPLKYIDSKTSPEDK